MATEQGSFKVYLPETECEEFRAIVAAKDDKITSVLRRMIRDYISAERERAAA